MRVVVLVNSYPAEGGHFAELAKDVELTLYGSEFDPTRLFEVGPPDAVRSRTFAPLIRTEYGLRWYYRGLDRALSRDRPDVLHIVSEPWGLLAIQCAIWARRHSRTALVIHGDDRIWSHGTGPKRFVRQALTRFCLARTDAFAAESAAPLALARTHGLARGAPTAVIHANPRDPNLLRPADDAADRVAARRRLGLPVEGTGVGFLGRLDPEKGPVVFLDAVARSTSLREGTWSTIAGGGPLEAVVKRRALGEGVRHLGTLRYPDEVVSFYKSIDVFVIPSWRIPTWDDQGPRVLVEAMMSGCVVVGSRSGAIPDMIGDVGFLAEEKDPAALADAIGRAVSAAASWDLRDRTREKAIAGFSVSAVAARLVELWKEALSARLKETGGDSARRVV